MSKAFVHATLIVALGSWVVPAPASAQKLLAEIAFEHGSVGDSTTVALTHCIGYGDYSTAGFQPGTPAADANLDPKLGCDLIIPFGSVTYVDFTAATASQFADFVARFTDQTIEDVLLPAVPIDAAGNVSPIGGSGGTGTAESDIHGSAGIDFIRLIVYRTFMNSLNQVYSDFAWQFWNGPAQFSGGGQRSEVNDFLRYRSPLETTTVLSHVATRFPLTITYGSTITPATFRATLNGTPLSGFSPAAGTTQTVLVPVAPGRNLLIFSTDGITSSGQTATDRDRITLIVP